MSRNVDPVLGSLRAQRACAVKHGHRVEAARLAVQLADYHCQRSSLRRQAALEELEKLS